MASNPVTPLTTTGTPANSSWQGTIDITFADDLSSSPRNNLNLAAYRQDISQKVQVAADYLKSLGFEVPYKIYIKCGYFPGPNERSHYLSSRDLLSYTQYSAEVHRRRDRYRYNDVGLIQLDLETANDISQSTILHELVHYCTEKLTDLIASYGDNYAFLVEGVALWCQQKFNGWNAEAAIDHPIRSNHFYRAATDKQLFKEADNYTTGMFVIRAWEEKIGTQKVVQLFVRIEKRIRERSWSQKLTDQQIVESELHEAGLITDELTLNRQIASVGRQLFLRAHDSHVRLDSFVAVNLSNGQLTPGVGLSYWFSPFRRTFPVKFGLGAEVFGKRFGVSLSYNSPPLFSKDGSRISALAIGASLMIPLVTWDTQTSQDKLSPVYGRVTFEPIQLEIPPLQSALSFAIFYQFPKISHGDDPTLGLELQWRLKQ